MRPIVIAYLYTQADFNEIFTLDNLPFGHESINFESSLLFEIHHSRYMKSLEKTGDESFNTGVNGRKIWALATSTKP